ncbi:MAG: hypothetical protein WC850_02230 [Candidatus Gracilibacteria bacterium]
MEETNLDSKIKANALTAYLLVFISFLFLFNKTNKYINNDFVKGHTKTAFLIHIMLVLVYVIFIRLISNYYITTYVSSLLFLILLGLLLLGMYKANKGEKFKIIDIVNISKVEKVADLHQHIESDERNKFSFFLSYIPFISYANYSLLNSNPTYNKVFKNNLYINLIISLIILTIYINSNPTLAGFLVLFYIIIVAFISVVLVTKNNFIFIYINHLNKIENLEVYLKTFTEYFKNYTKTHFVPFTELLATNKAKELAKTTEEEALLKTKNDTKLPKFLIYIPIINLIYLFSLDTKYRFHIINGISLTIISLIMLFIYRGVDSIFLLLLYPICFGIGNMRGKLAYKQIFVFHIFNSLILIKNKLAKILTRVKETKNTVKQTEYKIEGIIEVAPKKVIAEVKEGAILPKEEAKIELPKTII